MEALGSDFEPAVDALVVAEISGPGGFSEKVQLYPRERGGSVCRKFSPGRVWSLRSFLPTVFP